MVTEKYNAVTDQNCQAASYRACLQCHHCHRKIKHTLYYFTGAIVDFVAIAVKVMYNIVNCYKSDLLLKKVTKNPTLIRFIIRGAPET